ncbi:MAG: protein kinase [Deltaproteobacteria bacterium]|nr:protein kinase [Deltaproteobacteria bacterium]
MSELVGTVLGGKLRLVRRLGSGAFGEVYEATHVQGYGRRAVKILKHEWLHHADVVGRLRREGKLAACIEHANICEVLDLGLTDDGRPYLEMPLLGGEALSSVIERGPLPVRRALSVIAQILAATAAAHGEGVIHRDLKPDNVFITRLGHVEDFVKVLDFGIAKVLGTGRIRASGKLTETGQTVGTPIYMAPEQLRGLSADARVDIHACGVILFEMLTGSVPYSAGSIHELYAKILTEPFPRATAFRPDIPAAVEAMVLRATAKDLESRYPSADVMRAVALALLVEPAVPPRGAPRTDSDGGRRFGVSAEAPTERSAAPFVPTRAGLGPGGNSRDLAALVGHELAGFRVTDLLGAGAMAVVFRAENLLNPAIVRALKVVRPALGGRRDVAVRLRREAEILERLQHPNVVRFFGLRTERYGAEDLLIMELELLEGAPLGCVPAGSGQAAPVRDAVDWIRQAAQGVAAAHSLGVAHGDLRPDNLFLTLAGAIKILDFGIARAVDDADRASAVAVESGVSGSPGYMAPEVCNGGVPGTAADVYALGLSLYELLLGHHPFVPSDGPRPSSLQMMRMQVERALPAIGAGRSDVPAVLEEVVARATHKDPATRYQSADALASALTACRDVVVAPSPPATRIRWSGAPADRARQPVAGATLSDRPAMSSDTKAVSPPPATQAVDHVTTPRRGWSSSWRRPAVIAPAALVAAIVAVLAGWVLPGRSDPAAVLREDARAARLRKQACDGGEMTACSELAVSYQGGRGVARDAGRAGRLYEKACQGGVEAACYYLGGLFEGGDGVARDRARAAQLYERACNDGEMRGCSRLGWLLLHGNGVPRDEARAARLFERACTHADMAGCGLLGDAYEGGEGVARDDARAARLHEKACRGGDMTACKYLGGARFYEQGCRAGCNAACRVLGKLHHRGSHVLQDDARAARLHEQACNGGEIASCNNLAFLYQEGLGVVRDAAQAARLFEQACNGGVMAGCRHLAFLYREGLGVVCDDARAAQLYALACDGGDSRGCYGLGLLYLEGRGVVRDDARAARLYEQACNGGEAAGCTYVGVLYLEGRGVVRDDARAARFYEQGCNGGEMAGCANLADLYAEGRGVVRDEARAAQLRGKAQIPAEGVDIRPLAERREQFGEDPNVAFLIEAAGPDGRISLEEAEQLIAGVRAQNPTFQQDPRVFLLSAQEMVRDLVGGRTTQQDLGSE